MQTFLSEPTFEKSIEILDFKRRNKQLTEVRQILGVLLVNTTSRWRNHPAVLMWKGHERALLKYARTVQAVCEHHGVNVEKNKAAIDEYEKILQADNFTDDYPVWWTDITLKSRVINTHQARLFVKKPEFYSLYSHISNAKDLVCCSHCNYFWPSHHFKNKCN